MNVNVPFVLHKHDPRSGSEHYDLRFLDPKDSKLLHSFAFGSDFLDKKNDKISGVKTRDHDPRWLELKSYRLTTIEKGTCTILIQRPNYFELQFNGEILKGKYRLFKLKTKRGDQWLFIVDRRKMESVHYDPFELLSEVLKKRGL